MRRIFLLVLVFLFPVAAQAYIDLAPTLGRVVREAQTISVVEVDRFSRAQGAVILKKVRDLKGQTSADPIRHRFISASGQSVPRQVLEWAEPGQRGVLFVSGSSSLMCVGRFWYQVQASVEGWWKRGPDRPDLSLAYYGTVWRLTEAVELMVSGKTAVITTVPHGADEGASFDLALNRPNLRGLIRVQRIRANTQMPAAVMSVSANPAYLVGQGTADEADIPVLLKKLADAEAAVRVEAADDLRGLGSRAGEACGALTKLFTDSVPAVRMSAAAAVLSISPGDSRQALAVLAAGLADADASVRRYAVGAAGLSGSAAAPLASRLAEMLSDSDELTRLAALEAVATLGPAAAAAVAPLQKLLDDPQTSCDAADALGRIGPAARLAQKRLAELLSSDSAAVRWAGIRAMAQIGGEEARPAVAYMIRELSRASEVDGYNMMVYLALLGPVAKDAIPAIESARIKNPVLRPAALWAIEPEIRFPWLSSGRFGPGMMQEADFARFIFECYIHELAAQLKPAAVVLAKKILDNTAGDVPLWAYQVLTFDLERTLPLFIPALGSSELAQRERAAVALGYMGPSAVAARTALGEALAKTADLREQRLLQWALRQITAKGKGF